MSANLKWASFFLCTIIFGASPYLFMLINLHVIEGNSNLNYFFFYILITAPVALIILLFGLFRFFKSRRA
jgi:hypothetical protein